MTNQAVFTKDIANKQIHVTRRFDAPVAKVWRAWTEAEILDKWWAPKPWKAETKTMDFKPGGLWLYSMVGPDNGERHWSRVDFKSIVPEQNFAAKSTFSDENGEPNSTFATASSHWFNRFSANGDGTKVEVTLTFETDEHMQKLIAMGFEGGFTMGLNNLEELFAAE